MFTRDDGKRRCYSVDTSALIDLHNLYPRATFPGIWERIESMIGDGRLIAAPEVLAELEQKDDELLRWTRTQAGFVVPWSQALVDTAQEIIGQFPGLIDPSKTIPDADPFVIAAAHLAPQSPDLFAAVSEWHVLTSERSPRGVRMPEVCAGRDLSCIGLRGLFEQEGWAFR